MKLEMLKTGIRSVVGIGVTYVVSNALKKLEDEDVSIMQKALGFIGAAAIAWYASDKITKYVDDQVDEIVVIVDDIIELNEEEEA